MQEVSVEELLKQIPSAYKLVVTACMRASELGFGAVKLTDKKLDKPLLIALQEIKEGKVTYKDNPEK